MIQLDCDVIGDPVDVVVLNSLRWRVHKASPLETSTGPPPATAAALPPLPLADRGR